MRLLVHSTAQILLVDNTTAAPPREQLTSGVATYHLDRLQHDIAYPDYCRKIERASNQ